MIRFEGATKTYGSRRAVDAVSLEIRDGRFCVLLGRSGSGKSTLMRMVNRLVRPDGGRVMLDGRDVAAADPGALRRGIGYVIQSVGLFPHWRVAANVATVPRLLGWDAARIARRVEELLQLVGLDPARFAERWLHELSGGQAQRVGLARALAADPPVLLMDEPFSALDPSIRRSLQREMRAIHARTGKTILFVTHDVEEALTLADQLAVLRDGKLVASGTPAEVLERQADGAVRELLGEEALAFHRLATLPAHRRARVETGIGMGAGERDLPLLPADATLKQALLLMLDRRTDRLVVETAQAGPPHILHLGDLLSPATAGDRTPP